MDESQELSFDHRYTEVVALRDGSRAVVRAVHPEDAPLIAEGFAHLSPESRYKRFFAVKPRLGDLELHYLSEVDFIDHVALGMLTDDEQPIGIGRFIRTDPDCAEFAIAIVDEFQGQGAGRLLLDRLCAAARERGIERFRGWVLADNPAMQRLIHALDPDALVEIEERGVSKFELAVPPVHLEREIRDA